MEKSPLRAGMCLPLAARGIPLMDPEKSPLRVRKSLGPHRGNLPEEGSKEKDHAWQHLCKMFKNKKDFCTLHFYCVFVAHLL